VDEPVADIPAPPADSTIPANDLVARDVQCPMCGYNLRGLIEPRCPECGFTFLWVELMDPARWVHAYVFEHHPHRNVWSFFKTLIGGLWPGRFWDSLTPSQPSRPGRLWLYCAVTVLLGFAGVITAIVAATVKGHAGVWGGRGTLETWRRALRSAINDSEVVTLAVLALLLPAWSLLTYWTMMIFGTSMRIAKVNPIHVTRCIIYCQDLCVWSGLFVAVAAATLPIWSRTHLRSEVIVPAVAATLTSILFFAYRMCRAYRLYMRFRHAAATVLATQVIVGLVVINFALFWLVSRRGG
jgi:hypothetical protein